MLEFRGKAFTLAIIYVYLFFCIRLNMPVTYGQMPYGHCHAMGQETSTGGIKCLGLNRSHLPFVSYSHKYEGAMEFILYS